MRYLKTGLLLFSVLGSASCSAMFLTDPPPNHRELAGFTCSTSNALPGIDIALGIASAITAVGWASEPEDAPGRTTGIGVGLIWAGVHGYSAVDGMERVRRCQAAQAELMGRSSLDPEEVESIPRVVGVAVVPPEAVLGVGDTLQLRAVGVTAGGDPYPVNITKWISMDPAVATVTEDGQVHGHTVGEGVILAVAGDATGTVTVRVIPD